MPRAILRRVYYEVNLGHIEVTLLHSYLGPLSHFVYGIPCIISINRRVVSCNRVVCGPSLSLVCFLCVVREHVIGRKGVTRGVDTQVDEIIPATLVSRVLA